MFYKMIEAKRNEWMASSACPVKPLISYMEQRGELRDVQIEAIQTYLFLKIACDSRPLADLFCHGMFNTLNLEEAELSANTRAFLQADAAAAVLFEYACLKNGEGKQVSPKLEAEMRKAPENIDCRAFFHDAFYQLTYTDYLFSLPMGAGKTYLMAAFIYLDLYFAMNEPHNPAFAHNFIIFAPSGLKSSVIPSLKTIKNFDPSWVIPEPAASDVKRELTFEVLDQAKTVKRSNKTKNLNVQKIASHQPLSELFGLVAITNAEKVILDRIAEQDGQLSFLEESDDEKDRQANELRNLIGKLPGLSVFIDEVHHAVNDEIKLRAVVNRWAQNHTVNSVIGFSGTPYLEKAEKIPLLDNLSVAAIEIANIVYYYPLIAGVGNFLKRPLVKIADMADSSQIIEKGVRAFFDAYRDTVYGDGTVAKLGIYCGKIEKLEEVIYPLAAGIAAEYGIGSEGILKFHKGNRRYPQPADSQMQFDSLDKAFSKIRIVLLVQIGKEGWDCRSLAGIILSQEGDCPKNMVLQTSCRCLRQVDKDMPETALIYLNESNAQILNRQLVKQHHVSLKEFTEADYKKTQLARFDRTKYLRLPDIDFYQLKVHYETVVLDDAEPGKAILQAAASAQRLKSIIRTTDLAMTAFQTEIDDTEHGAEQITFHAWLYRIAKGSFGMLEVGTLYRFQEELRRVFDEITYEKQGAHYFSSHYNQAAVASNIRKAFSPKRTFKTTEELIPQKASLLNIGNFTSTIRTARPDDYFPAQDAVEKIILDDKGKLKASKKTERLMKVAEEAGEHTILDLLRKQNAAHSHKNRSFHYLPYHADSGFEARFLNELLSFSVIEKLDLEVYYNGDRALTELKIKCYKPSGGKWQYIGMYTPDFLIIQRKNDRIIDKAVIVETKGSIYANDPNFQAKKRFAETEFVTKNNESFGYKRFDYLYLEDTLPEHERIQAAYEKICGFFQEGNPLK